MSKRARGSVQTRAKPRAKPPTRAQPARRGRKPGQTSPAIAASARENGESGGRPRDCFPAEVIERLGPPPPDVNGLRVWNARSLAELQVLAMRGAIGHELAATLRAGATALDRALPAQVRDDDTGDPDEDDDDEPAGPELEADIDDAGEPLRVG